MPGNEQLQISPPPYLERIRKEDASKLIPDAQVSNICISASPCRYCLIDGGLGPLDERV